MGIRYRVENMMRLRDMNMAEIEKKTGLAHASVWNAVHLQDRKMLPKLYFYKKIANALGCTVGWLIQDREWE